MSTAAWSVPMVEITPMHWALWAYLSRQRWEREAGMPSGTLARFSRVKREPTLYDVYAIRRADEDLADAIGRGMRWLRTRDSRRWSAVNARVLAASDHARMQRLADRWGVTPARVSQLATEGQRLVEAWVDEALGA